MVKAGLLLVLLSSILVLRSPASTIASADCTRTLSPGDSITAAASQGGVTCLAPGAYGPFILNNPASTGIAIRGPEGGLAVIETTSDADIVLINASQVTLSGFSVRGKGGIYASRGTIVTMSELKLEGASIGVHIDENSSATLENVSIVGSQDVGLLVRNGASVEAKGLQINDSATVGVAAVSNARALTMRKSEVSHARGPGIFAGISGCGDLGAGTLDLPSCFYSNLPAYVSQTRVLLESVSIHDGPGTGVVFFPGVTASVEGVDISNWGLTGLFSWGAKTNILNSTFNDNVEHAIEYRSFPDPRGTIMVQSSGRIEDTLIRRSKPLPDGGLGGGVIAQAAHVSLSRDVVEGNTGIGVLYENGSSGELTASRIISNGRTGVCINSGNIVSVRDTVIVGNAGNDPHGCGG